jgi:hypothetical protein
VLTDTSSLSIRAIKLYFAFSTAIFNAFPSPPFFSKRMTLKNEYLSSYFFITKSMSLDTGPLHQVLLFVNLLYYLVLYQNT